MDDFADVALSQTTGMCVLHANCAPLLRPSYQVVTPSNSVATSARDRSVDGLACHTMMAKWTHSYLGLDPSLAP